MSQNSKLGLDSMVIKGIIIAVVTVLMLIPITMVESLIHDRAILKEDVTEEISSKWGGEQTIVGPVLVIPYTSYRSIGKSAKVGEIEYEAIIKYAYFLPDIYNVDSKVKVEERSRSIYNTLVYQTENKISGTFSKPKLADLNIKNEHVRWNETFIIVGVPYMQGIKNKIVLKMNDKNLEATPGVPKNSMFTSGLTIKNPIDVAEENAEYKFELELNINGSEKL